MSNNNTVCPFPKDFCTRTHGGFICMDGVKPFDQEQIAPGLGLGYENNEATESWIQQLP
jgi:hypothetical protein